MAAQKLAGEGFTKVINLKGGIKAWNGQEAYGRENQGLQLFKDLGSASEILITAYSLEEGLKDFYLKMIKKSSSKPITDLFRKLADIEDLHKNRLFKEYSRITGQYDQKAFESNLHEEVMEGGMTTEEYLDHFKPDFDKVDEVIGLAMSIEAQALDLYTRAARKAEEPDNQTMLNQIAVEEQSHLTQLGNLLDKTLEGDHG